MTDLALAQPGRVIPRDRYGRPMVLPPAGDRLVPYRRVTSYVDVLGDRYALEAWKQRNVAVGLTLRPDLLLRAAAARGDRQELDAVVAAASEAAGSTAAATSGTALHDITAAVDLGQPVTVPAVAQADVDAYRKATAALTPVLVETFVVLDELKVGGTFDRLVRLGDAVYVADLKTGSIEHGAAKIAMQLAAYSRGQLYDPRTGGRSPLHADQSRGIVIHLPSGQGQCTLHWVDLDAGWEGVQIARQVWEWRARRGLLDATPPDDQVIAAIAVAPDQVVLRALWSAHRDVWTARHTEAAKARLASLTVSAATAAE